MLKKVFLAFLLTLLIWGTAIAIVPEEAKLVATNWLRYVKLSSTIQAVEPVIYEDVKVGYLVKLFPAGFILVPDVKALSPIKFWSKSGSFSKKGFLLDVLKEMYVVKMNLKKEGLTSVPEQPAWAWLEGKCSFKLNEVKSVEKPPLITTTWSQGDPYNKYCPQVNGAYEECKGRAPAGCVAIAMAQIMRYYRCPIGGVGNHSYLWEYGNRILSADFNHPYDWLSMPNFLNGATSYQIDQVARAIYDIGVAVEMEYTPEGSGASFEKAVYALVNYFKYNPSTIRIVQADVDFNLNFDLFYQVLKAERDENRVTMLGIVFYDPYTYEPTGGHAVVVDGYREVSSLLKQIHINMGWGGRYDGYYALVDVADDPFYSYQAVIGIVPTEQQVSPQPQPSRGGGGGCSIGEDSETSLLIFAVILIIIPLRIKLLSKRVH